MPVVVFVVFVVFVVGLSLYLGRRAKTSSGYYAAGLKAYNGFFVRLVRGGQF